MGGFEGVEDKEGQVVEDVQMLTLEQESKFDTRNSWCQTALNSLPHPLESATVEWVDTFNWVASNLGNSSFSSSHPSTLYERALVCGGASSNYVSQHACW